MSARRSTPGRPPARPGPASGAAAWPNNRGQASPRARRLAYENGIATPTMNMNDGWIRSQNGAASPRDMIELLAQDLDEIATILNLPDPTSRPEHAGAPRGHRQHHEAPVRIERLRRPDVCFEHRSTWLPSSPRAACELSTVARFDEAGRSIEPIVSDRSPAIGSALRRRVVRSRAADAVEVASLCVARAACRRLLARPIRSARRDGEAGDSRSAFRASRRRPARSITNDQPGRGTRGWDCFRPASFGAKTSRT